LGAWFVPATGQVDTGMAVLVAPGNGGNRAGRAGFAEELSRRGLAVRQHAHRDACTPHAAIRRFL
jgi:hypothetical protein